MTTPLPESDGLQFALVCLRTGLVLEHLSRDDARPHEVGDVASASPELFGASSGSDWAGLFARFGSEGGAEFREIVLVSPDNVRVMERLPDSRDVALVAIATGVSNVGFVLSGVRRRLLELSENSLAVREHDKGA